MMARLAPESRMTEFFGLYTMSGEATAWAAPLGVAIVTRLSGSQQWGMAAILIFLIAGLALLWNVREQRAEAV
jgi:MFS transporter, UMF1 family